MEIMGKISHMHKIANNCWQASNAQPNMCGFFFVFVRDTKRHKDRMRWAQWDEFKKKSTAVVVAVVVVTAATAAWVNFFFSQFVGDF